jgi:RluA family pseudouridine synthase
MHSVGRFTVRGPERGLTLDRILSLRLAISRKKAKQLLNDRRVFVNRRRVWMAHHNVRVGDEIEVAPETVPLPRHRAGVAPRILYADSCAIVVNKPAGIPSVGPDSAESALRASHPEIQPVHRLDRDTSGCLLFARSDFARASLEKQFEERRIEKIYKAIVIGAFPERLTRVEKPIEGLTARTDFRLMRRTAVASLIEARPKTGRTHQIRVHLQAIGFPLAGDRAYATRGVDDDILRHLPRQMLHAWRVAWRDPMTGDIKKVQAALPPDFRDALFSLKLAHPSPR